MDRVARRIVWRKVAAEGFAANEEGRVGGVTLFLLYQEAGRKHFCLGCLLPLPKALRDQVRELQESAQAGRDTAQAVWEQWIQAMTEVG